MRSHIGKILLAVLLTLCVGSVPLVIASSTSHGESTHEAAAPAEPAAGHGVEATQEHGAAVVEHGAAEEAHPAAMAEHGAAAEGEHGAAHGSNPLSPEKLKDLFWRTVNFVALLVLLVYFLAKPIGNGLSGRQKQVREELEDLEAKRDEAQRSYREFEAKLAGMEKEMERVVEKAIAQAQNEKERILAEAEKSAEDIKRQAEAAVHAEMVDARRRLLVEAADAAAVMAEELIVKNLTPEDHVAITEKYLDRVGAVQ